MHVDVRSGLARRSRSTRGLARVVGAALLALAALYAFALGTGAGLALDRAAVPVGLHGPAWGHAHTALAAVVHTINIASLALVGAIALGVALARGGRRRALRVAICLAGANLTTHLLKPALGVADPLGGDQLRVMHHSFPSGHATVAMSVAFAILAVAPLRWRGACAALGAGYAAAVGVGLVMTHSHYPSDVLGGYLVATAWAGVAVLLTRRLTPGHDTPGRSLAALGRWRERLRTRASVGLGAATLALAAGWAVLNASNLLLDLRAHATFLAAGAAIALAALALAAVVGPLVYAAADRPDQAAGA